MLNLRQRNLDSIKHEELLSIIYSFIPQVFIEHLYMASAGCQGHCSKQCKMPCGMDILWGDRQQAHEYIDKIVPDYDK